MSSHLLLLKTLSSKQDVSQIEYDFSTIYVVAMSSELYEALDKDPNEAFPEIQRLLDKGVEINDEDPHLVYKSPLYVAAEKQDRRVIELLLDYGAHINAPTQGNMPPLTGAVVRNQVDNCKVLLERGADAEIRNNSGKCMLELAVRNENLAVVELLLDHGIDVNTRSSIGGHVLFTALAIDDVRPPVKIIDGVRWVRGKESFSLTKLEIMRLLIDRGIDIDRRIADDSTCLHIAAVTGDIETVKILLDAGADPNVVDDFNRKPLQDAIYQKRTDIVKLLLPRTTNINDQAFDGATCLSLAANLGFKKIVKLLLKAGAEIWSREPGPQFLEPERRMMWYGWDALYSAAQGKHDEVERMILVAGAERQSVEPDFPKQLRIRDRNRQRELRGFREWLIGRCYMGSTPEHLALRNKLEEEVAKKRKERDLEIMRELGLPIIEGETDTRKDEEEEEGEDNRDRDENGEPGEGEQNGAEEAEEEDTGEEDEEKENRKPDGDNNDEQVKRGRKAKEKGKRNGKRKRKK